MSRGPWRSKQAPDPPPNPPDSPWKQMAELFEARSAQQQSLAQTDGHISAWLRTIGMRVGEIPPPPIDPASCGNEEAA